jgi:hypothetical protein
MAWTISYQRIVWLASCVRPFGVSRLNQAVSAPRSSVLAG